MINDFWANWCKDKPLGNIENLLKDSPELINAPDYNIGDLVNIRCQKHLKTTLHQALGTIEKACPASGIYLIQLCHSGGTVVLNKYELMPAMNP